MLLAGILSCPWRAFCHALGRHYKALGGHYKSLGGHFVMPLAGLLGLVVGMCGNPLAGIYYARPSSKKMPVSSSKGNACLSLKNARRVIIMPAPHWIVPTKVTCKPAHHQRCPQVVFLCPPGHSYARSSLENARQVTYGHSERGVFDWFFLER